MQRHQPEEIKSLEHERNVAMVNGDAAELDRMTCTIIGGILKMMLH
jgi:hypothetical protein